MFGWFHDRGKTGVSKPYAVYQALYLGRAEEPEGLTEGHESMRLERRSAFGSRPDATKQDARHEHSPMHEGGRNDSARFLTQEAKNQSACGGPQ